jgi:hypothetical protein
MGSRAFDKIALTARHVGLGVNRDWAGKLQVQPCPQCPVSDGRPEKGGLSRWANNGLMQCNI